MAFYIANPNTVKSPRSLQPLPKAPSLPMPLAAATPDGPSAAVKHVEEAITATGEPTEGPAADKCATLNVAAATPNPVNGELLPIDSPQSLTPEAQEIVRQSDAAFVRLRQTWCSWKQVRAGLVVLRDLAMRETGANDPKSKLYKNRFHELLEVRAYCAAKMEPSVRKALLQCAEPAPKIDEWHDHLDEYRRQRLNHPVNVLRAFRESQKPTGTLTQANGNKHERELETVRQEAATAVSSRDERIGELQKEIDKLSKRVDIPEPGESDVETIVPRVIAMCGGDGSKIRQVIDALNAHLEPNPS